MNFWNKLPKPFFALAPMEDVTDVVFRQVVAKAARPDVFWTEFMNVSGFCHPTGRDAVAVRLQTVKNEQPIVAQIWGNKPQDFEETARKIAEMDFAGIDINMGCPDKSVVKAGGGAALIKNPELAVEIINAVKAGVRKSNLPISVKTRLGFSKLNEWQLWLITLLRQNLDALTVHLRTRKEMSKVDAHYELIPEIIKLRDELSPTTKLIINGDITDRAAGMKIYKANPQIDGFMIGRGVFINPFCFELSPRKHSNSELIELLKYHLDLFDKKKKENHSTNQSPLAISVGLRYEPLKKFFKIYVNNFAGANELRIKLMETKNTNEARKVLNDE